jgi:hypothetical protein
MWIALIHMYIVYVIKTDFLKHLSTLSNGAYYLQPEDQANALDYGTKLIAGVTPGRGGTERDNIGRDIIM